MRKAILATATAALIGASAGASATLITQTFNASGVTDSFSQQGTAIFQIDTDNPDTFTVRLLDNVSPTGNILSVLNGISFSLSQPVTSINITGITPTSVIDCTASSTTTCPQPNPMPTEPFGWNATVSGGTVTLGAGFDSSTSSFKFHPFGIVNANYNGTGLSDAENNPLLVGPVTFTFSTDVQAFPEILGVTFLFGTVPDPVPGAVDAVPEPHSLALLGIALVAGWVVRSRRSGKPALRIA
jgi:hypothetical protein